LNTPPTLDNKGTAPAQNGAKANRPFEFLKIMRAKSLDDDSAQAKKPVWHYIRTMSPATRPFKET